MAFSISSKMIGTRLGRMKTILLLCFLLITMFMTYSVHQIPLIARFIRLQSSRAKTTITHYLDVEPEIQSESHGSLVTGLSDEQHDDACYFPKQDPFDSKVMKIFRRYKDHSCKGLPSLVYLEGDTLRLDAKKAELENIQVEECKYRTVSLSTYSDSATTRSIWRYFKTSIEIKSTDENIVAVCSHKSEVVSKTYLTRIVKKRATEKRSEKNYKRHVEENLPLETLSVLMVGLDGTSRQNTIRSMPKTRDFILKRMNAVEFYKFNKVGENTWPNMLPMTSGLTQDELMKHNWTLDRRFDKFDHLFVWNHYQRAGYRTALMLDHCWLTAFHYQKQGWRKPPFDYYYRAMSLLRCHEGVKNRECVGNTPETTFMLDYWLQLATMFNNTKTTPYFALNFNMRATHDFPFQATMVDTLYFEFFQELVDRNVINNTIVVFYADHGARFGPLRLKPAGILETNTPFLFFMFPHWFNSKYPGIISNVRINQHRLTTMFDVHETLKDILYFKGKTGKGNLQSRGISLFNEIPYERLCHHAGVSRSFCMCSRRAISPTPSKRKALGYALLKKVVSRTSAFRKHCLVFSLRDILNVFPLASDTSCGNCSMFRVTIIVAPGGAIFEGVLQHDNSTDSINVLEDHRLTRQGKQQKCLKDNPKLNGYCYCVDTNHKRDRLNFDRRSLNAGAENKDNNRVKETWTRSRQTHGRKVKRRTELKGYYRKKGFETK